MRNRGGGGREGEGEKVREKEATGDSPLPSSPFLFSFLFFFFFFFWLLYLRIVSLINDKPIQPRTQKNNEDLSSKMLLKKVLKIKKRCGFFYIVFGNLLKRTEPELSVKFC